MSVVAGSAPLDPSSPVPFVVAAAATILACAVAVLRPSSWDRGLALPAATTIAAAAAVVPALSFLTDTLSPAVLRLPFHHCGYCALERAPEVLVGAVLFAAATTAVAWAATARFAGGGSDTARVTGARLLRFALFGYLSAAAIAVGSLVGS